MFARVTVGEGKPEQIEAGIRNFREQVGDQLLKRWLDLRGLISSSIVKKVRCWE